MSVSIVQLAKVMSESNVQMEKVICKSYVLIEKGTVGKLCTDEKYYV